MTRRELFSHLGAGTAALATLASTADAMQGAQAPAFTLPALPYAFDALEPSIDAKTMEIHHDRHHAGYVANLNKAVATAPELAGKPVEQILADLASVPDPVRTAVRNNGGGHANHSLFWQAMKKGPAGQPTGELAKAIDTAFGSFSAFQDKFTAAALGQFGSGWAWLALRNGQLTVEATPNQDSPWMRGGTPILGIDVWEHAYYLKYQNRRADYIKAWYEVVNWDLATERYLKQVQA
jgi:superoxide dismutase, Fe-Mn family